MVVPGSTKNIRTRGRVRFHDFAVARVRTVKFPVVQSLTALAQSCPSCLWASVCAGDKTIQGPTDIKDNFSHRASSELFEFTVHHAPCSEWVSPPTRSPALQRTCPGVA